MESVWWCVLREWGPVSKVNSSFTAVYIYLYMSQQPCVQSKCPWARQWAGKVEKSGEEGSSLSPKRRKRQPKQAQISCALLRRQGAEHGVLVDATKPLKTNLPPSFHAIYPNPDTQPLHRYRPQWLNINAQSRVMIRSKKTVIVFYHFYYKW